MVAAVISSKKAKEIYHEAHHLAYKSMSLFLDKHYFKQGRIDKGLFINHGFITDNQDIVTVMRLVTGAKLNNRHALPQIGNGAILRLLRQSFVGKQAWIADDVQVTVKNVIEYVAQFVNKYTNELEVFAKIHESATGTNCLMFYIALKETKHPKDHMAWEITIDDVDLVNALTTSSIFI